jgi:hypothetical protein
MPWKFAITWLSSTSEWHIGFILCTRGPIAGLVLMINSPSLP